jgi:hypothetical protein
MSTADLVHKATANIEIVDNKVNGQTEEKIGEAVDALTQPPPYSAFLQAKTDPKQGLSTQYPVKIEPEPENIVNESSITGDNMLGGYRVTKRRRNPRRKQKKSYRRRRI